jgi:hypothetical protein
MPEYQHSCFISYKHPPRFSDGSGVSSHFWDEFVRAFKERLESRLTIGLSAYWDQRLRSAPGVKYPSELAQRLCRSVCMIAILVPEYFESSWCLAEWKAMERLEQERTANSSSISFIIPILFRGDRAKAEEFCGHHGCTDFTNIYRPAIQLNTKDSRRTFEDIARQVSTLAKIKSPTDCSKFLIHNGEEVIQPSLDDDPNPLV